VKLEVRVIPNARKNELSRRDGQWTLRLNAPAIDGRANRAAIEFLAAFLHVPKSKVTLVVGEKSRHKIFEIAGLNLSDVEGRLA
jgi:uncharacterized protein (TIGR00251 family)